MTSDSPTSLLPNKTPNTYQNSCVIQTRLCNQREDSTVSFFIQMHSVFSSAFVLKSNVNNGLCMSCNVKLCSLRRVREATRMTITMRDRSKNRKPLQKGRNLSIEAIQTVQALKRVKDDDASLHRVFGTKFSRLLRLDMIAVLKELIRQDQCLLAFKAFEDIQNEHWYKPKLLLYAELISVFGRNEMFDKLELVFRKLEDEISIEPDIEGFNAILETLLSFGINGLTMECFYLMKSKGCEPDRSTFKILISGLESKGETSLSVTIRKEAEKAYGSSFEFLEENEDVAMS